MGTGLSGRNRYECRKDRDVAAACSSALLLFGGVMIGGRSGLEIALVLAVVMNFGGYFFSDKIALATYSAQPVNP